MTDAIPWVGPPQVKRRSLLRHLTRLFRARGLTCELEKLLPREVSLKRHSKTQRHSYPTFSDRSECQILERRVSRTCLM
jgi:hypothetical protein